MTKCAVPFIEGFTKSTGPGNYRNCCATNPQIVSNPDQSFDEWWQSKELNAFRELLKKDTLPKECSNCELQEKIQGTSFRTAVNQTVNLEKIDSRWPSRWNISFSNICNLACWMCNEYSSSVIQTHKKKLGMLSIDFQDPEIKFQKVWQTLKHDILKSYNFHDYVSLTILGGEPLYNKEVLKFLKELVNLKLSNRTKLEFHTNATQCNKNIMNILDLHYWKHICMFLSIDATGRKAEWLRYGTNWKKLENNVVHLSKISNYIEVHCILSVLNVGDLPELKIFCDQNKMSLKISALYQPWFMSLENWDKDPAQLVDRNFLKKYQFEDYYNLIGKNSKAGAFDALKAYIKSFDTIRKPLNQFDPVLAKKLDL
jgi:organic radical activating enzyme